MFTCRCFGAPRQLSGPRWVRFVCRGPDVRCLVCQSLAPHQVEEWAWDTARPVCPAHGTALIRED